MEVSELDNFTRKFKNLWHAGKSARLQLETCDGYSWVSLHVRLGSLNHPQHCPRKDGPARQRRRERRAAARDCATRVTDTTEEVVVVAEENIDDATTEEVPAVSNNDDLIDVAEKAKELTNIVKALEMEKDTLETKVRELQEECDCLNNTIQVNDMIHESFKERVRDKYCYDTNDEDSDYEPDHDIRAKNRDHFLMKKIEEQRRKCNVCHFVGTTVSGLKIHKNKKHKDKG